MRLPIITLTGTPYEQGQQHGAQLRDRIAHNLAVYFDRFRREVKLDRAAVLEYAAHARDLIQRHNADYFAAMRGVADGSGFDLLEITALNVRYEILYYQFGALALAGSDDAPHAEPDGCTSFALLPERTANGHLIIGQNWDWIPQVQGAVLHTTHSDGVRSIAFTEAGIVGGKIGLSSAGIGLAINGITTTDDDWSRPSTPFHVRCYEILRSRDFDAVVKIVTDEARACSTNYLLAQTPDQVIDIEAAPDAIHALACEGGCVVHANHFVDPDATGVIEPPSENRPYSRFRSARMRDLINSKAVVSVDDLQAFLRDHQDHPYSLCRHEDPTEPPEEHYITVAGVVMDLTDQIMYISDGPPCQSDYQQVRLI